MVVVKFMMQLGHLKVKSKVKEVNHNLLAFEGLINIPTIINLFVVVFIGGFWTFMSKIDFESYHNKPDWLTRINVGTLKIMLPVSMFR